MRLIDEFYKSLSKREKRVMRRKEREDELTAIRRNRILRKIFFWTICIVLVLASGLLLVKIANQTPYQPAAIGR